MNKQLDHHQSRIIVEQDFASTSYTHGIHGLLAGLGYQVEPVVTVRDRVAFLHQYNEYDVWSLTDEEALVAARKVYNQGHFLFLKFRGEVIGGCCAYPVLNSSWTNSFRSVHPSSILGANLENCYYINCAFLVPQYRGTIHSAVFWWEVLRMLGRLPAQQVFFMTPADRRGLLALYTKVGQEKLGQYIFPPHDKPMVIFRSTPRWLSHCRFRMIRGLLRRFCGWHRLSARWRRSGKV